MEEIFLGLLAVAWALGTPIVASPGSVSALPDVIGGHHALIAGHGEEVADAVALLLGHAVVAHTLARNARELAERAYGWPAIAAQYEAVLQRVAGRSTDHVSVAA